MIAMGLSRNFLCQSVEQLPMDRDWWVDSLVKQRLEIVEQIRDIHVRQSQSLRHVRVPEHTLKLAKSFVKQAPNVCVLEARKQCLRYEVLYSFSAASGFGVYQLLAEDAKDTPVQLADDKFNQWLAAVGSLLRYALNLLLAPKRPEFQTIKVRFSPPKASNTSVGTAGG